MFLLPGEIADSSPAISALSARKAVNHSSSLDWKELAIVTKNSAAKQPQVVSNFNLKLKQPQVNIKLSKNLNSLQTPFRGNYGFK